MTITKIKSSKLEFEMENSYIYITVARGLPELAKTLERLNCFRSEYRRGYQSKF